MYMRKKGFLHLLVTQKVILLCFFVEITQENKLQFIDLLQCVFVRKETMIFKLTTLMEIPKTTNQVILGGVLQRKTAITP